MDWPLYSFVSRSKQRVKIVMLLEKPIRPTDIAKQAKLNKSHVSRTLNEFVKKGIAKCLTPDERVGRYYVITDKGKDVISELKKRNIQ